MVDERLLAQIFRAAAKGIMDPYYIDHEPGSFSSVPSDYEIVQARVFTAIADVFENVSMHELGAIPP